MKPAQFKSRQQIIEIDRKRDRNFRCSIDYINVNALDQKIRTMKNKLILIMLIFFLFQIQGTAQENLPSPYQKSWWFDIGGGSSTRDRAITASLNIEMEKRFLLTFSYDNAYYPVELFNTITTIFSLGLIPPTYKAGFDSQSIGLKLGKVVKSKWGLLTFSVGTSVVTATEFSNTKQLGNSSAIGFSMDAKILPAYKFVGLAISPFYNINGIQSYGGLTLNLALGKLNY